MSIDFTIPEIQPVRVRGDAASERFYVPLSVLRKWPPLLRLDLRTGKDEAIPLLTRSQNGIVDRALLEQLSKEVLKVEALPEELAQAIPTLVEQIDTPTNRPASLALQQILPPVVFGGSEETLTDWQQQLRGDDLFVELAGGLRDYTLLWLRVEGRPGDREIAKFGYDIEMRDQLRTYSPAAFGLQPFEVEFEAPHLGNSGSYHLILSTPPPVSVIDSEVVLKQPGTQYGQPESTYVVAQCSSGQAQAAEHDLQLYTKCFPHDARFYVAGDRTGLVGSIWVALLIDKRSFVRAAALSATAIAAVLGFYLGRLDSLVTSPGSAVSLLLLVPGLLAYLLVRPTEHPLVGQFLTGLRHLLMLSGSLALIGAAALVLRGSQGPPSAEFRLFFVVLFILALLSAGMLILSVVLPTGKSRRPLSEQAKQASTAPRGRRP